MDHIGQIKEMALKDSEGKKQQFMEFLNTQLSDPNKDLFNLSSGRQMQQFLHAPFKVQKKEGK